MVLQYGIQLKMILSRLSWQNLKCIFPNSKTLPIRKVFKNEENVDYFIEIALLLVAEILAFFKYAN